MRCLSCLYFCWSALSSGACAWRCCIERICLTVSGTITIRTISVSAMIAQAHGSPSVEWIHSRTVVSDVLDRAERIGDAEDHERPLSEKIR